MHLVQRNSPIIWEGMGGPLTETAMRRYSDDGFIQIKEAVPPKRLKELKKIAQSLRMQKAQSAIAEPKQPDVVRSIFDVQHLAPQVPSLVLTEYLLAIARQILGPNLYIHQCHINYKEAWHGGEFHWHSDFTYWYWEDGMKEPRALSLIVFLDPHTEKNGAIECLPGSHMWYHQTEWVRRSQDVKYEVTHQYEKDEHANGLVPESLLSAMSTRPPEKILGEPGDVLLMDANTVHSSGPNRSSDSRHTLLLILNSLDNKIGRPYSGLSPRPDYISSRDFTPIG